MCGVRYDEGGSMALAHDRSNLLSDELRDLQALARDFVRKELLPLEREAEGQGGLSPERRAEVRAQVRDVGLWCPGAPEELGGGGLGMLGLAVLYEEFGHVVSSLGGPSRIVGDDPSVPLAAVATEEQRERILRPIFTGERESAVAMTEPDAGSDLRRLRTTAVRDAAGDWVINGTKRWISGAACADYVLTYARTTGEDGVPGLTLFAVEAGTEGFAVGANEEVAGRRGITENELTYVDCVVPEANVIGGVGNGLEMAGLLITHVRMSVAAHSVGTIARLLRMATEYSKSRHTFGEPLAERQAIQWKLAGMAMAEATNRAYVRRCAELIDAGMHPVVDVAMAKLGATRAAFAAADETMQIFGGLGYSSEMPVEAIWRDTRLYRIIDGADEILTRMIARDVLSGR
jgi:alkylation response protein AidB-like acyl-CoA dehydrogenase